jgi:hypothetical protein
MLLGALVQQFIVENLAPINSQTQHPTERPDSSLEEDDDYEDSAVRAVLQRKRKRKQAAAKEKKPIYISPAEED